MPRRSVLIIGVDANGEVGSSLPWVGTGGDAALGRLSWADGRKMEESSTPWPKTMVGNCPAVVNSGHGNILQVADTGLTTSVSDLLPVPCQPAPFTPAWDRTKLCDALAA